MIFVSPSGRATPGSGCDQPRIWLSVALLVVGEARNSCSTGDPEEAGIPIATAGAEAGGAGVASAMTRRFQMTHSFSNSESVL